MSIRKLSGFKFDFAAQERKIIFFTAAAVFAYSIFAFFVDFKELFRIGFSFDWRLLPFLLLLSFVNYLFRIWRFFYYLQVLGVKISFKKSAVIFLSTLSMTLTPGKSGELIRAYLVKRAAGKSFFKIVPVVVLERVMDGIAMLILGVLGVYFFMGDIPIMFFLSLFPIALLYLIFHFRKRVVFIVKKLERRLPRLNILESLLIFFSNSEQLIKGRVIGFSLILSILSWCFEAGAFYLLLDFFGFSGLKIFAFSLFVFSFSSIAGFFAMIPGGVGVAEGSILSFLTFFLKMSFPLASFITLVFRMITLWFGVFLGIVFFSIFANRRY